MFEIFCMEIGNDSDVKDSYIKHIKSITAGPP